MSRSRITANQIVDADVLTEAEHDSEPHYFKDLVDVATVSGNQGKYLKIDDTTDTIVYATVSGGSGGATSLLELTDTPSTYVSGKFLKSTAGGTVWATVSGSVGSSEITEELFLISDINFDTRQVKKATIGITEGVITTYVSGTWQDYSDFYIVFN